jgi:hypothetical protein
MNGSQKPAGGSFAALLMLLGVATILCGLAGRHRDEMAPDSPRLHQGYSYGPVAESHSTTGARRWKLLTSVGSTLMLSGVGLGLRVSFATRRGDRSVTESD